MPEPIERKESSIIPGAIVGMGAGIAVGFALSIVLWFVHGFAIGASNDYQLGQKYDATQSFTSKVYVLVPVSAVVGAWLLRNRK